jgi:hypothetical protein
MKKITPQYCQLSLILIIALLLVPTIEAYSYSRNINCTGITSGTPIAINGTYGVTISGVKQIIWTNCKTNLSLQYNNNTYYAVFENTSIAVPFDVRQGNATSINASSIYSDRIQAFGFDTDNTSSSITKASIGANGTYITNYYIVAGKIGNAVYVNGSGGWDTHTQYKTYYNGTWSFNTWLKINMTGAGDYLNGHIFPGSEQYFFPYYYISVGAMWLSITGASGVHTVKDNRLDWNDNQWHMITWTKATNDANSVKMYLDGVEQSLVVSANTATGGFSSAVNDTFGMTKTSDAPTYNYYHTATYDELSLFDIELSESTVKQMYNNTIGIMGYGNILEEENSTGSSPTISFISPTPTTNTVQYYTNNTIQTAITITNSAGLNSTIRLYNTTSLINSTPNSTSINFTSLNFGTYYINASLINSDGSINTSTETRRIDIYTLNINISSPTNNTQINRTLNLVFNSSSTSDLVNITKQNITIRPITDSTSINRTIGNMTGGTNTTMSWDTFSGSLTPGLWYVFINSTDTQNNSETDNIIINLTKDATVNITARYILTNTTITNFSINITDNATGTKRTYASTDNKTEIEITQGRNYTLLIDAPGYAYNTVTGISFNQTYNNYTIYAYTDNSVLINIYDETTGFPITQNITLEFTQNLTDFTNTTITGSYYQAGLSEGSWDIKLSGANYTLKTYTITVSNRSTQTLNAYLSTGTQNTIFTIMDYDTGLVLPGASIVQSRLINGSWTLIDNKISDISGRVQLTYVPTVKYQFLVTLSGYDTNLFYLDPVLFSTYNIRMTKTTTLTPETTPDYTAVDISFYNNLTGTNAWYFNRSNVLIWIISSPIGSLENYNLTLIYPSGNHTDTGILATGEQFTIPFNITSANSSSRVYVNYCYKSTTSGQKCFVNPYSIIGAYDNTSIIANIGNTYGLGIMERAIISTIVILMVGGLFFMVAGFLPGLLISIILMGFLSITGFMTPWMVLPSLFIGIIIIMRGGKE